MERPPPPSGPPDASGSPEDDELPPPPPAYEPTWTPPPVRGTGPIARPSPYTPPPLGREPRRTYRWWFAAPVAVLVYLLVALVTLVQPVQVASLSLTAPIPGLPPERIFGLPDRPFNVMIVGLDVRPSQQGGPGRTDSVLVIQIDEGRNRAAALSIPRDTMMAVPDGGGGSFADRINTAYVYNWALTAADCPNGFGVSPCDSDGYVSSRQQANAIDALAQTIENNLGIAIDYHIVFHQRGAAEIIDAAGGVDVFVRTAFGQENYSDDDVNVVPQFFEEGTQHLDGYSAVAYGRIREGTSDFDRIRRQQQVAEGLVEQLSSPTKVFALLDVYRAYNDSVETDLGMRQSAGVFLLLKRIGTDRIVTRSLGDAAVSCSSCTASLVQLLPDEAARIIAEAFDDEAAGQTAAQLLLNAGVTP